MYITECFHLIEALFKKVVVEYLFTNLEFACCYSIQILSARNPVTKVEHKEFRREIALTLVKIQTGRKGKAVLQHPLQKVIRNDNVNHMLESTVQDTCPVC